MAGDCAPTSAAVHNSPASYHRVREEQQEVMPTPIPSSTQADAEGEEVSLSAYLQSINLPQDRAGNRRRYDESGGLPFLKNKLCVDVRCGLGNYQVEYNKQQFGDNSFPVTVPPTLFALIWEALTDTTIVILVFAAILSLSVELALGSENGWVEGVAILSAVVVVASVGAGNNYFRNLQFLALEKAAANDQSATVKRNDMLLFVHPSELVVGDIILLGVGDLVPADCILVDPLSRVQCDESSLTGESTEVTKQFDEDCFLLSSSLVLNGAQCQALVIAVGLSSQWGRIKNSLSTDSVETPLQEKLERLAKNFSYMGAAAALCIYLSLVVRILATTSQREEIVSQLLKSFIFVTTVVVAAVPEGLPLAVTLTLAFCNRQLYGEHVLVRTLAACETMGNVTTICTDKTGTLTENRMTVVTGCFHTQTLHKEDLYRCPGAKLLRDIIAINVSINRTAYSAKAGDRAEGGPQRMTGNFTELALLRLITDWGYDADEMQRQWFDSSRDKVDGFNSFTKQSAVTIEAPVHLHHGGPRRVKILKGAPEHLIAQCQYCNQINGEKIPLDEAGRRHALDACQNMSSKCLRTIALAHEFFDLDGKSLSGMCLDGILGIHDPLREDIQESISIAQRAGIKVRLMTGDSLPTALAIAVDAGILPHDFSMDHPLVAKGVVALTGERFRSLSPKQLDAILPSLTVIARCSPEDKLVLVSRLSGNGLPETEADWTQRAALHSQMVSSSSSSAASLPPPAAGTRASETATATAGSGPLSWEQHRDSTLPGYLAEWQDSHPEGGEVVAVTGDGTNDAPALKAADIGLAMGLSGTKVAQAAADMVLLDDNFKSIVQAILWGRTVYDNVRKFLQFQMTANITALAIIFTAAVSGVHSPLNAVQILWLNMVMDPLGALALALEPPDREVLLQRRPYKRNAALITSPVWRNVICQSVGLVSLMLCLMFANLSSLGLPRDGCSQYSVQSEADSSLVWDVSTGRESDDVVGVVTCSTFDQYCSSSSNADCLHATHSIFVDYLGTSKAFVFADLQDYESSCLECSVSDETANTFSFNVFMFYQIFNLWNARTLFQGQSVVRCVGWQEVSKSYFLMVMVGMATVQWLLVCFGGDFLQTAKLSPQLFLLSMMLGAISLVIASISRCIPASEADELFASNRSLTTGRKGDGCDKEETIALPKYVNSFEA